MLGSAWLQGERVDALSSLRPHAFPLLAATIRLQTPAGLRSRHWFSLGWSCNFFSKCFRSDACPGKVRSCALVPPSARHRSRQVSSQVCVARD